MKFEVVKKAASPVMQATGKLYLKLVKKSPELLIAGGIVGVAAATVMACKKSSKAKEVIEEFETEKADAKQLLESEEEKYVKLREENEYDKSAYAKDIAGMYFKLASKMIRIYALPALVFAVSTGFIIGSHNIMSKRLAGVTAAYTGLEGAFKSYREAVVKDLGEEADFKYRYGAEQTEVEVATKDEKGKIVTETHSMPVAKLERDNPYAHCFNELTSKMYTGDSEYDRTLLTVCRNSWQNSLDSGKTFCLNEVLKSLGIEPNMSRVDGQVIGWGPGLGDSYVDFRAKTAYVPVKDLNGVQMLRDGAPLMKEVYYLDFNAVPLYL